MLKKFVSLVVGVSLALATIGVAAMDDHTIATTSEYNAATETLTVTTTVGNAEKGSTYTYLVYDNSVGEDSSELEATEIKYVDQKVYDATEGTNLEFEFEVETTDAGILLGDVIKVGGKTKDGKAYGVAADIVTPGVTVNGEEVSAAFGDYLDADVADEDYVRIGIDRLGIVSQVKYTDKHAASYDVTDFIVGYDAVWIKKLNVNAANSIAITTISQSVAARTLAVGHIAASGDEGEAVIAVGQVQGDVLSYGIQFSTTDDFANPVQLEAMGRGTDGKFAIKLVNFKAVTELENATNVFVRTYYQEAPEAYQYNEAFKTVVIPAVSE